MGVVKLADYRPQLEVVEHRVAELEDGYTRTANTLLEAAMLSGLTLVDASRLSVEEIRSIAERHKQENPNLSLIMADYLGLIEKQACMTMCTALSTSFTKAIR